MSTDTLEKMLVDLEKKLLEPEFRQSKEFLENTLHEDFVEIGASGRRYSKQQTIDLISKQPRIDFKASGFRVSLLSDTVVLLTFSLTASGNAGDTRKSIRSSIWKKENIFWRLIFHQGTAV